jgi:hypothetical protein
MGTNRRQKSGCDKCNFVQGYEIEACPICGGEMHTMSAHARPPKRYASKKKWERFWRKYAYWRV